MHPTHIFRSAPCNSSRKRYRKLWFGADVSPILQCGSTSFGRETLFPLGASQILTGKMQSDAGSAVMWAHIQYNGTKMESAPAQNSPEPKTTN